jgi:hypothetical protein
MLLAMKDIQLLPVSTTSVLWPGKNSVTYNPSYIWGIFKKKASGVPLAESEVSALWDFYISIGIIVIKDIYPHEPVIYKKGEGVIRGNDQLDELSEIIARMDEYYEKDLPKRVLNHFPTCPNSESENRIFHSHFKKKARQIWIDIYRKKKKDPVSRIIDQLNDRLPTVGTTGLEEKDETYSSDMLYCQSALESFFSSRELFEEFQNRCGSKLQTRLLEAAILGHLKKGNVKPLTDILSVLLRNSGYTLLEQDAQETLYQLFICGSSKPVHPEIQVKRRVNPDQIKIGLLLALEPQFTDVFIKDLKKEGKTIGLSKDLIISNLEKEDRKKLYKGIGNIGHETWELLELAEYIQRVFVLLPPDEQAKMNTLIEELTINY